MNNSIIRDADFAMRLSRICDNRENVPPLHGGRYQWVVNELAHFDIHVSTETVRKWFWGEVRPRPDKMKALATILKADEAFLSLGIKSIENGDGDIDLQFENERLRKAINVIYCAIEIEKDFSRAAEVAKETLSYYADLNR